MEIKILIIAVIHDSHDGKKVLLRKKPGGAPPYKESWYLFGTTIDASHTDPRAEIINSVLKQTGFTVTFEHSLSWDTEIKNDHDGIEKYFIYLDCSCKYVSGKQILSPGIEKIEWVPIKSLITYDLVPPTRKLFKKLGYL